MGNQTVIHPTLIQDQDTVILLDAGLPGISGELAKAGVPLERLKVILITHQDMDHIGGLPSILSECRSKPLILAHEGDKPYIEGEKRLIKITDEVLAKMDLWPEAIRNKVKPIFENPPKAKVDKTVVDGEELPYCGGITVIHTPGHTPGHCCYYHKPSKTLIAGDILNAENGVLSGPVPQYTADIAMAVNSLNKLQSYDVETVICYHGGKFNGDFQKRLAEIMNEV